MSISWMVVHSDHPSKPQGLRFAVLSPPWLKGSFVWCVDHPTWKKRLRSFSRIGVFRPPSPKATADKRGFFQYACAPFFVFVFAQFCIDNQSLIAFTFLNYAPLLLVNNSFEGAGQLLVFVRV